MANLIPTAPLAVQDEAKTTPAKRTLAYQSPDSRMTLREGLEEYFRENPGLMDQSELPRDLGLGLRSHDVAHVVFGCHRERGRSRPRSGTARSCYAGR